MADAKKAAIARKLQTPKLPTKAPTPNPVLKFDKNVTDRVREKDNDSYIAWQTANGKAPDLGKGQAGPGTPYREIEKDYKVIGPAANKIQKPSLPPQMNPIQNPKLPMASIKKPNIRPESQIDAKAAAIRRRLNGG